MDKLKIALDVALKYQFWVLCGVMLVVSLTCWWLATAGAAKQYKDRTTKIEADFSGTNIEPNHPNQQVIDKIREQQDQLKKGVFAAWETLYTEQKEKNPFPTKVLGEDFKRQFESLDLANKGELRPDLRSRYQNYLSKDYIPTLQKLIDVRHPVEESDDEEANTKKDAKDKDAKDKPKEKRGNAVPQGMPKAGMPMGGAMGGAGATDVEWTGIVDWAPADYDKLLNRFSSWHRTPSTLEVVVAQEDLWVYEALLRVIQRANEGATTQAKAAVKQLNALEIGSEAAAAWKASENALFAPGQSSGAADAGPGMPGAGPGMPPAGGGGGMGMPPGGGGMGMPPAGGDASGGTASASADQQLFAYRYVDDKGQPLPSEPEYPYAKHPYAEFKMMPVRLSLVVDERSLPKLLVECANSSMPIEVRAVRLLKTTGEQLGLGGGTGGAGGGRGPGMGPGMGGMGMPMPNRGGAGIQPQRMPTHGGGLGVGPQGAPVSETGQYDVPVEIHAVIYIYNPPDRAKLGTGAAAGQNPTDGAAPGNAPGGPTKTPPANPG